MKRAFAVIAACVLSVSGAAFADESHDPATAGKEGHQMRGMHEHMKLMREPMAQIRAATDPKERERLMSEHMKTMEQSMSKMQGMMGCAKM